MTFKIGVVSCFSALVFASAVMAADMPSSGGSVFDYQGQTNLGLAPETPDDTQKCRLDQPATTGSQSDEQGTTTDPNAVLSTSTDLDANKRRCGALTLATLGTASYVERQSGTSSTPAIGGLLLTGAVVGIALLDDGSGPAPTGDGIPFPIPGAGLLSYLVLGGSGVALWVRRRFRSVKDGVKGLIATTDDAQVKTA